MYIVAGPPVSGKSAVFPVSGFGVESFNADDRAAQLNRRWYRGIPQSFRATVNRLFEAFVHDGVARRSSFAVETTLRSSIAFDKAASARREGFFIEMHYLALNNFAQHVERVKIRADGGVYVAEQCPEWLERALMEL